MYSILKSTDTSLSVSQAHGRYEGWFHNDISTAQWNYCRTIKGAPYSWGIHWYRHHILGTCNIRWVNRGGQNLDIIWRMLSAWIPFSPVTHFPDPQLVINVILTPLYTQMWFSLHFFTPRCNLSLCFILALNFNVTFTLFFFFPFFKCISAIYFLLSLSVTF